MRRILIALIAAGLLLVSGVAASAKFDSNASDKGQNGQHQNQTQTDKKVTPAAKATDEAETKAAPATKPAATVTKPAATTAKPSVADPGQCGFQGEQTGEHDDAACNDQNGQAGANESKSEANDKADLPEKDSNQQGNNQD